MPCSRLLVEFSFVSDEKDPARLLVEFSFVLDKRDTSVSGGGESDKDNSGATSFLFKGITTGRAQN
jgi:hypothetical protein